MNLDARISQIIPFETMLPAVGQGAMAIEIREEDAELQEILQVFDDEETRLCITAERAFLRTLEGGCQVPIGANAVFENDKIHLEGMVGSLNGSINWREKISGANQRRKIWASNLAQILIEKGANELLEITREKVEKMPSITGAQASLFTAKIFRPLRKVNARRIRSVKSRSVCKRF